MPSTPILPEVVHVHPGDRLPLCRCGFSPCGPDCPADCISDRFLDIHREQYLLLCRCGCSARRPGAMAAMFRRKGWQPP